MTNIIQLMTWLVRRSGKLRRAIGEGLAAPAFQPVQPLICSGRAGEYILEVLIVVRMVTHVKIVYQNTL